VPLSLQGPYGGPLPEYWVSREDLNLKPGEKNPAQPADETGSHGWGSVPLLWLHDSLLGVRIVELGGARLRIAPETGGLAYVAGHTATPKGGVWVYYDPQQWRVEVRIPEGVTRRGDHAARVRRQARQNFWRAPVKSRPGRTMRSPLPPRADTLFRRGVDRLAPRPIESLA